MIMGLKTIKIIKIFGIFIIAITILGWYLGSIEEVRAISYLSITLTSIGYVSEFRKDFRIGLIFS